MGLGMVVVMMGIWGVKETFNADLTIVSNLVPIIMRRMTAARGQILDQLAQPDLLVGYMRDPQLVKDVTEEILEVEDVALLSSLAMKEREIVMDQVMEAVMMVTQGVKGTLCVDLIIVKSLVHSFMRKMTVVRDHTRQHIDLHTPQHINLLIYIVDGGSGALGVHVLGVVVEGSGQEQDIVEVLVADTACSRKIDFATRNPVLPIGVSLLLIGGSPPLPIGRSGKGNRKSVRFLGISRIHQDNLFRLCE